MLKNQISKKRKTYICVMRALMLASTALTCGLVLFLTAYVLVKGIPNITWELLSAKPSYLSGSIGILPDILNTVYIIIAALVIVLPLGAGAAVYLTEYAQNQKLVSVIEYAAETLSGIPSIIYGLVGMLFFCQFLNMQTSLLAGALTLVIMNLPKQEDILKFSERIYAEAQRMIRLVEDIIKLSHLDEGANDMKREEVDLYALAEETVQSLKPEAQAAGVRIELCGKAAVVCGIRQLLGGILFNLCDNAIKYNRRDGAVFVTIEEEENSVILSVADTGIGIPAEHQERIFERFYRVDKSHSKEIGGTGLGLSIVKHAVKLHGASIGLDSRAGSGTTVTVRFPREKQ